MLILPFSLTYFWRNQYFEHFLCFKVDFNKYHRYIREIPDLGIQSCVMASSAMEAQFGGLRDFANHTRKNNAKQMYPWYSRAVRHFTHVISSRSDRRRRRWLTHLTNHSYFDNGKTRNPQFVSHAGIKMAQVVWSPLYICDKYTSLWDTLGIMLFMKDHMKWQYIDRISWKVWYWFVLKFAIELDTKKNRCFTRLITRQGYKKKI